MDLHQYVHFVSRYLHTHTHQYSIEVTDGVQATKPKIVDEIKDVQSSPYEYTVKSKEEKIGFILHSGDETAYSGE